MRTRTEPFPPGVAFRQRRVVAGLLTALTVLLLLSLGLGTRRQEDPEHAVTLWLTVLLALLAGAFTYRAWRWVAAAAEGRRAPPEQPWPQLVQYSRAKTSRRPAGDQTAAVGAWDPLAT